MHPKLIALYSTLLACPSHLNMVHIDIPASYSGQVYITLGVECWPCDLDWHFLL